MALAQAMQAEEFNDINNSRTGANSDEDKNYQDCLAPVPGVGTGAELDDGDAYYQQHGVRQGDAQQEDQLIGGPADQLEEARYRQFVIDQQRALAEIRRERERREREEEYDPQKGWAPRLNNRNQQNRGEYTNSHSEDEKEPLMNNEDPLRAPYQR